ncbi:hypothetical protein NMG60_11024707 [Bertholletia excelsa]
MEEELPMLRQLIAQSREVLELFASSPYCNRHLQPHNQLLQLPPQHHRSWCIVDLDDNFAKDDCCKSFVVRAEKPGTFRMLEPCKPPPTKRSRKQKNQQRLPDVAISTEIMEHHIWKEFPEDLFEAVIARLPITTFFRFRCVSRKWNSLPSSLSFSQQCAQVTRADPWFYTITQEYVNSGALYNPSLKKWHHPTFPALPTKLFVLPVASAGGLVCFIDTGNRSFYICNPLTRAFKELPSRSVKVWSQVAVGMVLNGESTGEGYKILWVASDGEYEVYDSIDNSWTCPGSMPTTVKLPLSLNFRSQAVSINGTLYFMRSDPDGIISYDISSGDWKQFVIPLPLHLSDHTLAQCGGQILLVGLLTKNAATCVCIWELQKMTLLWKEVDRMPNIWCLEFYGKHMNMICLGNKGILMLSLRSRQMNRLVTYNIKSREWQKVPSCILPWGRKRQWISRGTAFHPCLTASA